MILFIYFHNFTCALLSNNNSVKLCQRFAEVQWRCSPYLQEVISASYSDLSVAGHLPFALHSLHLVFP